MPIRSRRRCGHCGESDRRGRAARRAPLPPRAWRSRESAWRRIVARRKRCGIMWAPGQIPMTTQTSAPTVPMTLREVLRLTVMRRVFYAQMVSLLGDFLAIFAVISVVTYRMHGTPAQVTGVQFSYMLPLALLGPLSGVFVDRWPLKPTLIASDLIRAVLVLLLFVSTSIWQIYFILAALSCVSSFF